MTRTMRAISWFSKAINLTQTIQRTECVIPATICSVELNDWEFRWIVVSIVCFFVCFGIMTAFCSNNKTHLLTNLFTTSTGSMHPFIWNEQADHKMWNIICIFADQFDWDKFDWTARHRSFSVDFQSYIICRSYR